MKCIKCNAKLEADQIRASRVTEDTTEIEAKCDCGAVFSAWIDHNGWAFGLEPVDLSPKKVGAA